MTSKGAFAMFQHNMQLKCEKKLPEDSRKGMNI